MWATTFSRKRTLSTASPQVVPFGPEKHSKFTEKHSRALLSCSLSSQTTVRRSTGIKSSQSSQGHIIAKEAELKQETANKSMGATGITMNSDIESLRKEYRRLTERSICREFKSFKSKSKSSRIEDRIHSSNSKDSLGRTGLSDNNRRIRRKELRELDLKGNISERSESASKASYKTIADTDNERIGSTKHTTEEELQDVFEEKIKELLASSNNKKIRASGKRSPIVKRAKSYKKTSSFEDCYIDVTPEKQPKYRGRLTKCPSPDIRPKRLDFKININGNVKKISVVGGGSPQRRRVSLWKKVILKQHHLACQQYLKSHYGLKGQS